ncbi:MAG: porin family protein [Rhodobacteraceae bacterium]|nr:porin family protein [Paracoccaceae bacterium]
MDIFFKKLSLACAGVVLSSAALAADLPPPVIEHIPEVPVAAAGGWYLRGDIGYKIYGTPNGEFSDPVTGSLRYEREEMDNAWMLGVGVGYKFTDYFRGDLTLDYETPSTAVGHAVCGACTGNYSQEQADVDIWTVMLNGYVDIGTWNKITPYVGAGIGASYVRTTDLVSINPGSSGFASTSSYGTWNLAWALMAGASYEVNDRFSIDAGYQYRSLGEAKTAKYTATGSGNSRGRYKDLTAHEVRVGFRYMLDGGSTSSMPTYYPSQPLTSNF